MSPIARARVCAVLAAFAAGCAAPSASADLTRPSPPPPGAPPVEAFISAPPFANPQLSPSGKYLAGIRYIEGYPNVVVLDLQSGALTQVTAAKSSLIRDVIWANEERLLLSLFTTDGLRSQLAAVNRDGSDYKNFSERNNARVELPPAALQQYADSVVNVLVDDPEHVLVSYTYPVLSDWLASAVFKLNIYSGRTIPVARSKDNPLLWFADPSGQINVGFGIRGGESYFVYRTGPGEDWTRVSSSNGESINDAVLIPIAAAEEPGWIYARSRHEGDRFAIYRYNVETGEYSDVLLSHPQYDLDGLPIRAGARGSVVSAASASSIVGITYTDDCPRVHWVDPEWAALAGRIDASLPNTINTIISKSEDDSRMLVLASRDRDPGTVYLFEPAANNLVRLFATSPDLDRTRLAEVKPISYRTRDGVEISGYLALPPGSDGRRVPIIVNPHGRPSASSAPILANRVQTYWSRVDRSYDPELQLFVSRGWGVFRANFRGSPGLGREHQRLGYKQWGLAMQRDLVDGLQWLIDQGIADPERVCIYGSDYGGYASIVALSQTPERFACAAAKDGIFDLPRLLANRAYFLDIGNVLEVQVGDPSDDAGQLRETSPIYAVDRIEDPVFLAYGAENAVVRPGQSRDLASALALAGKPHFALPLAGQPHFFLDEQVALRYYRNLEAFFATHLGSGAPAGAAAGPPAQAAR